VSLFASKFRVLCYGDVVRIQTSDGQDSNPDVMFLTEHAEKLGKCIVDTINADRIERARRANQRLLTNQKNQGGSEDFQS
jgi:hypothetical protein